MKTLTVSRARKSLYPLMRFVEKHGPVRVEGRASSAVLVDEAEYRSLVETMHIMSTPGLVRKIRKAQRAPRSSYKRYEDIR